MKTQRMPFGTPDQPLAGKAAANDQIPDAFRIVLGTVTLDSRDATATDYNKAIRLGMGMSSEWKPEYTTLIDGGTDDDRVAGSTGHDWLKGKGGDDVLFGGAGIDKIKGGHGDDRAMGGAGDDAIDGGMGHDVLRGGAGHDWLRGEDGDDALFGGAGIDRLRGDAGDDHIHTGGGAFNKAMGGAGNDRITGGWGDDWASGGMGDDMVFGRGGDDKLTGHAGADRLVAGRGDDQLFGGQGDDRLVSVSDAGRPNLKVWQADRATDTAGDALTGGTGADEFAFSFTLGATRDVLAAHTGADGEVDWDAAMAEDEGVWVQSLGRDVVHDFDRSEGDRLVVQGSHVRVHAIDHRQVDGQWVSIVSLSSTDHSAEWRGWEGDLVGRIEVHGDRVTMADIDLRGDSVG